MTAITYDVMVDWDHNGSLNMPYPDEVLQESNLVGYWRMEETSGTNADDASPSGIDGTYVGPPTLGQAGALQRPTGAGNLCPDMNSGRVDLVANAAWNTLAFSAEVWANPDTLQAQGIIGKIGVWRLYMVNATGVIRWERLSDGAGISSTTLLAVGSWYHMVITYDSAGSGTMSLYINGVLENSQTGVNPTNTTSADIEISFLALNRWTGRLDEAAWYNSALSAARVLAHYQAGATSKSTSPREYVTTRVRSTPGVSCSRGRDQLRELTPPEAGSFDAELDNTSKDYSPEYASSPLSGKLLVGRRVGLKANNVWLWRGLLDDLPQYADRTKRTVGIPSIGPLSALRGKKISTALYQNILTSTALGHVLDAAGWPSASRLIDTGKTTLKWWWVEDEDAFEAATALWATEGPGANLYEDGEGRIVFESRHYRLLTSRSLNSQATLRDTGADPNFQTFGYEAGIKDVVNKVTATVITRSTKSGTTVWTLDGTYTLGPNEVRSFVATAGDPFNGAITPVSGTDYTVSAGSISSVTLDRTSGQSCLITFTAGASGATITGLQLRANPVTQDSDLAIRETLDMTTSRDRYGVRTFPLDIRQEIDPNVAQDFANAIVRSYSEPRPTVQAQLINANADNVTHQLAREVSDRVTVVEPQTGLDTSDQFYVESIAHETDGHVHRTTFGLEKIVETQSFWLLGVAGRSELGSTTVLGY